MDSDSTAEPIVETPQVAETDLNTDSVNPESAPAEPGLEDFLAEYEREAARPEPVAEPTPELEPILGQSAEPLDDLDQLLASFNAATSPPAPVQPGEDAAAIEARVRAEYERALFVQHLEKSVTDLSNDIQGKLCPETTPPGVVEGQLRMMADKQPELGLAWYAIRAGVNPNKCRVELDNVRQAAAGIDPTAVGAEVYRQRLERYAGELQVGISARQIVKRAIGEVVRRAKASDRRIDHDVTADKLAVVQL